MEAKEIIVYFNKIKVNIKLSGVMSESADACIVPQFDHGISLSGISCAFIHSPAVEAISKYQKLIAEKTLKPNDALCSSVEDCNYKYLIQIPVLILKDKTNKTDAIQNHTTNYVIEALKKASSVKATSIVLPSMNTGIRYPLSYSEAARAILAAIKIFSKTPKANIKEITIALTSENAFLDFVAKAASLKLID